MESRIKFIRAAMLWVMLLVFIILFGGAACDRSSTSLSQATVSGFRQEAAAATKFRVELAGVLLGDVTADGEIITSYTGPRKSQSKTGEVARFQDLKARLQLVEGGAVSEPSQPSGWAIGVGHRQ